MKGEKKMGGNEGLSLVYDEMEAELQKLQDYVIEFQDTIGKMTSSVNMLCDNWTSSSTEGYREDYLLSTRNMGSTVDAVNAIIADNYAYIADMKNADSSHSTNRVSTTG